MHITCYARSVWEILARRYKDTYTKTTSFLGDKIRPERGRVVRDERLRLVCRRLKDEREITIKARQNTAWIWPRLKLNCILSHSCHYTLWNVELVLRQHEHTSRAGSGIMTRRGINKTIFPWIGVYVFYIHVDKKSCCPTNSNHCVSRVITRLLRQFLHYHWGTCDTCSVHVLVRHFAAERSTYMLLECHQSQCTWNHCVY